MSKQHHAPIDLNGEISAAVREAVEVADANLNNVLLPLYSEVVEQRNDLLAALEKIATLGGHDSDEFITNVEKLQSIASAAIAKAKGE